MKRKGFTLVELIVVIILVGAVGVLTVPALLNSGDSSKETIKTSKIEAIKVAANNYVEDNLNSYSDCNSLKNQNNIMSSCTISIERLIEDDYLDRDKDQSSNVIIDPTTDKAMSGKILTCYDMNTGEFLTEYYEEDVLSELMNESKLCAKTGVHTLALQDNSLAISYHDDIDFYTNIFMLGDFENITLAADANDLGVAFSIQGKKLHVTYEGSRKQDIFSGDTRTINAVVKGRYNNGEGSIEERSATFSVYVYDKIDETSSQLSIIIRPNTKLKELTNFKNDVTLTCTQKNEYGCEINLDYFHAYFNKTDIQNYEYINEYSLGNEVTFKSQTFTGIAQQDTYRIYSTDTVPVAKSIKDKSVLYINIVPSPKKLTFDAQGGSVSPDSKIVTYGDPYGTLPTPTKTGYIFGGWYETTAYAKEIKSNTIVEKIIEHTVYAKWTPIKYTIAFNGNGSTSGSMSSLTNRVYDTSYTLTSNAFLRTGYIYGGWNTKANGSGTSYTNGASVKNLTTTNGTTVTLYAQWTPIKYDIKFDGNGATGGSMSNLSNRVYDTSYTLTSNAFSRTGYIFDGWNTKANGTGTSYANGASVKNLTTTNGGTVTLYAKWTPIKYTIAFNGNGSTSGSMSSLTNRAYDTSYTLTANAFAKNGNTFNGWNTKANGSGTSYANRASVKNLTTTNGETVTLYAQWQVSVSVSVSGGSTSPTSKTIKSGTSTTFTITADSTHKLAGGTVSCSGGGSGNFNTSSGVLTVSNVTSATSCTVTLPVSYYCPSGGGTLTYNSTYGYICTKNSEYYSYYWDCSYTTQSCSTVSGVDSGCVGNCQAAIGDCSNPSVSQGCGPDGYDYICSNACSYSTQVCTDVYVPATCGDAGYDCPSGFSRLSGSGSSMVCYKAASQGK